MLIDSNLIIYAVQKEYADLREWLIDIQPNYSVISRVEVLGYHRLQAVEKDALSDILEHLNMIYLSQSSYEQAINLKQQHKMSLGDALIAATCIEHNLTLATRNTDDFKWIAHLNLINPIE